MAPFSIGNRVRKRWKQDLSSNCAAQVKAGDVDRYLAALFAPAAQREHLFALYAFNLEVARIPDMVSEPMLGEIRLQWWRETIDGIYAGTPRAHYVAQALARTIDTYELPRKNFESYLIARQFDLYEDSFKTRDDLQTYAMDTAGILFSLSSKVLVPDAEPGSFAQVSKHGSAAYVLTSAVSGLGHDARRRRTRLPLDVSDAHQVNVEALYTGKVQEELRAAIRDIVEAARRELNEARHAMRQVDQRALPAYLPLSLCAPRLNRMERPDFNPFLESNDITLLSRQIRLLWHMALGRI